MWTTVDRHQKADPNPNANPHQARAQEQQLRAQEQQLRVEEQQLQQQQVLRLPNPDPNT